MRIGYIYLNDLGIIHMKISYWHDLTLLKRNCMARKKYYFHDSEILGMD